MIVIYLSIVRLGDKRALFIAKGSLAQTAYCVNETVVSSVGQACGFKLH